MNKRAILGQQGFTLIELLIALFISVVIGAATIGFMTYSHKSHAVQEQVADSQQNARIALDQMTRDLRMAGYPMGYFKTSGFVPIETGSTIDVYNDTSLIIQTANSSDSDQLPGTDAIAIWRGDSGGDLIRCDPAPAAGTVQILSKACINGNPPEVRQWDFLLLISPDGQQFETRQVTGPASIACGACPACPPVFPATPNSFCVNVTMSPGPSNINPPGGLGANFTGGTAVKFKRLVYYVDPAGRLMRSDNNARSVPLATNVEDLQLGFQLNDGTLIGNDPGEGPANITNVWNLRQVRLNLLTRTANPDPLFSSRRPGIENRPGEDADVTPGFRRRLLQEEIQLRNLTN